MTLSVVISQPYNIKPSKDSLRSFLKSKKANNVQEKSDESHWERFFYVIGKRIFCWICLKIFQVTLYSAVAVVIFSENAQGIMNIIGSSFYSLVNFQEKIISWS